MSVMSELDLDRQYLDAVQRAMEDDMGDEPMTPKEIAADKVARAVRDCWLASAELVKLRSHDPFAAQFIIKEEGDLWAIKLRVDALLSEIREANGETPLPKWRAA